MPLQLPLPDELDGVAALCDVLRSARSVAPLRFWAGQQYLQSISLGPAFAALAARVPLGNRADLASLMELAHEETWDLQARNHGEAFKLFYASLGGNVAELDTTPFLPETTAAARVRLDIARGKGGESFHASLSAIAIANEDANLAIFASLERATRGEVYASMSRVYFDCHLADEEAHRHVLTSIAARHSPHPGEDVEAITGRLFAARNHFFAAVAAALQNRNVAVQA